MPKNGKSPGFLKKHTLLILKISFALCAASYILCYLGGQSENSWLAITAFAVLCLANLLPVLL